MALVELSVENLAVIERIRLSLRPGFTVLTGETGAGKSLVVDALGLVLGSRAAADQVRSGAEAARAEAIFDSPAGCEDDPLADLVADGDGQVIIRREVRVDGRSVARVNDRSVTIGSLAALGERLAEIHGQHEQQRLFAADRQLALLDRFAGLEETTAGVGDAYLAWRATVAAAAELVIDPRELARRQELLQHQVDEIEAAALRSGEEDEVVLRLRAASHAEAVAGNARAAAEALVAEGGGTDALREALAALRRAASDDPSFSGMAERADGLVAEATELGREVGAAADQVELDPAQQAALDERLALIRDLQRKYGRTSDEVTSFAERASRELEQLDDQEQLRDRLRNEVRERRALLERLVAELRKARETAATALAEHVNAELPPLGLPKGAFGVALEPDEIGARGGDRVTFTFAPNPGEPARPLGRIASGGEASRLSLALKVVLAAADETPLLVFDEVDAGVGGRHAGALGERLRALSEYHQVVCVTHLPQVAAYADTHVHIGKRVVDGRTVADVVDLDADARAAELAAMLAGEAAGAEARSAAEALLRSTAR